MPDVTVRYNNEAIVELSDSGTKILKTKDTICEDDIEVEYNRPTSIYELQNITFTASISDGITCSIATANITATGDIVVISGTKVIGGASTEVVIPMLMGNFSVIIIPHKGITLTVTADGTPITGMGSDGSRYLIPKNTSVVSVIET